MSGTDRSPRSIVLGVLFATLASAGETATDLASPAAGSPASIGTIETNVRGEQDFFTLDQCLVCHQERDRSLVETWRNGPHAGTADCIACHGERHGALPAARHNDACTDCHGGSVTHSYVTSKHGVLSRVGHPDWSRPLRRGEYRSPGCAYCHLHDRDHGDTMAPEQGPAVREWVCSGCHAPRFVTEQLDAGDRLTEIARLKKQEAQMLADRHPLSPGAMEVTAQAHPTSLPFPEKAGATEMVIALEALSVSFSEHLRNVRLGAGHQSPDYQWWHGQAALDGDLIRLRDAVETARRRFNGRAIP